MYEKAYNCYFLDQFYFCTICAFEEKLYLNLFKINKKSKILADTEINQSGLEKGTFPTERVPFLPFPVFQFHSPRSSPKTAGTIFCQNVSLQNVSDIL